MRTVWMTLSSLIVCLCSLALHAGEVDPKTLFESPVPLGDTQGQPIVTGKAQGCPYAADYNGDGVVDLILGAKDGMNTATGGIWLIPNRGSNAKPDFQWSNAHRVAAGEAAVNVSCGCKSSGQVQPIATDWNGDGWMDIVYSDTYRRTYLLINEKKDREKPTFKQQPFFEMEKKNHGMYSGGGDWNNDGVLDFLHMTFAGGQYKLFKGTQNGSGVKFAEGGLKGCEVLKFDGKRDVTKARKCAWAWDYSGTARTRKVTEYVGVMRDPADAKKEIIGFYEIADNKSRMVAVLHAPTALSPLLTACDVNADGKMDILFSCGLWNNQKGETKIYVMYGKVENAKPTQK